MNPIRVGSDANAPYLPLEHPLAAPAAKALDDGNGTMPRPSRKHGSRPERGMAQPHQRCPSQMNLRSPSASPLPTPSKSSQRSGKVLRSRRRAGTRPVRHAQRSSELGRERHCAEIRYRHGTGISGTRPAAARLSETHPVHRPGRHERRSQFPLSIRAAGPAALRPSRRVLVPDRLSKPAMRTDSR